MIVRLILPAALESNQKHNANPAQFVESSVGFASTKYKRLRLFGGMIVVVFSEFYEYVFGAKTGAKRRDKSVLPGAAIESAQMFLQNE